jgi:hypothetical protein
MTTTNRTIFPTKPFCPGFFTTQIIPVGHPVETAPPPLFNICHLGKLIPSPATLTGPANLKL